MSQLVVSTHQIPKVVGSNGHEGKHLLERMRTSRQRVRLPSSLA